MTVRWDPLDYAASSASQARWGRELLGRMQWRGDERVVDVGCGDGRLTAEIAAGVPRGEVVGIDASPDMIRHAREVHPTSRHPNLRFQQMDASHLALPARYDVVFSNAALHWVSDHLGFLKGAAGALRSGGRLLVSCGGKGNAEDVFTALRSEMRSPAWRAWFRNLERPYFFHDDKQYRTWLDEAGFRPVRVQLIPKSARHADRAAFTGWFRTTWMPYTQRVPEERRGEFIEAVVGRYLRWQPVEPAGSVTVRMVRLELEAVRV